MTTVTLLIFSGRRDPIWELTPGEVAELIPLLREFEPAEELSGLGYRGFMVQSDDPDLPPKVIVCRSPRFERFLLRTGERQLPPEIIRVVEEAVASS